MTEETVKTPPELTPKEGSPLEGLPLDAALPPTSGEDSLQSGPKDPEHPPRESIAKVRITLIDDEPSVLFALKLLLEALGFAISDFSDSELALAHLSTPDVADVCLCDLRMPKRNGLQVLEEVKKRAPQVPFILMSAHATDAELQKAKLLGANGVLTKPFTPDDLQAALASVRKNLIRAR